MYLKNNFQIKVVVVAIIAAILIFSNLYKKTLHLEEDFFQKLIVKFYLMEFEGVVTKRFIDEKNHGYRKVIFRSMDNEDDVLFLDFENDNIFYSFKVGDTIVKKQNTLNFSINRNSQKFVKKFNFDAYVDRDNYDENLDSIIFNYLKRKDFLDF